jgi:apolipoprotein N-acyltransferase
MRPTRNDAINLALAILGGLLLRWSFGLHPLWWLAWIAPALFVMLLQARRAMLASDPAAAHVAAA